jgi:hypothetical protein
LNFKRSDFWNNFRAKEVGVTTKKNIKNIIIGDVILPKSPPNFSHSIFGMDKTLGNTYARKRNKNDTRIKDKFTLFE